MPVMVFLFDLLKVLFHYDDTYFQLKFLLTHLLQVYPISSTALAGTLHQIQNYKMELIHLKMDHFLEQDLKSFYYL